MSWNNASERKNFELRQQKQAEEYRRLGMTEEQIREMYLFDLSQYNSDRKYARHTQSLEDKMFDDETVDESDNSLLEHFLESLSCTIDDSGDHSRYWWIEEIDNPKLAQALTLLSDDKKELLTSIAFDGRTQKEIAADFGVSQQALSKKLQKIKKNLSEWL